MLMVWASRVPLVWSGGQIEIRGCYAEPEGGMRGWLVRNRARTPWARTARG